MSNPEESKKVATPTKEGADQTDKLTSSPGVVMPQSLGRHILAEFFDCDEGALANADEVEKAMHDAAIAAEATVLTTSKHFFSPWGVSCVIVIAESNLCIHTWPEFGYAAADFFTCGSSVNPWKAFDVLRTYLQSKNHSAMEIQRGSTHQIPKALSEIMKHSSMAQEKEGAEGFEQARFFTERDCPDTQITYKVVGEPAVEKQSAFQKINIGNSKWWGKMLMLDNVINVTEKDEFIYHEMIVHVPMMTHPDPRRVLIIGGGDGAAAREVLRHPNLDKFVMVDIDGDVIELCKKHIPSFSDGAFDDKRLELIVGDGIEYVKNSADNSFDVIIVDSTDPIPDTPGEILFTDDFYQNVHRILSPNGVMTTQALMPMRFKPEVYKGCIRHQQKIFSKENTFLYLMTIDSYGGQQSFSVAVKGDSHPYKNINKERIDQFEKEKNLKYYNYKIHQSSFVLPNYIKKIIVGDAQE